MLSWAQSTIWDVPLCRNHVCQRLHLPSQPHGRSLGAEELPGMALNCSRPAARVAGRAVCQLRLAVWPCDMISGVWTHRRLIVLAAAGHAPVQRQPGEAVHNEDRGAQLHVQRGAQGAPCGDAWLPGAAARPVLRQCAATSALPGAFLCGRRFCGPEPQGALLQLLNGQDV